MIVELQLKDIRPRQDAIHVQRLVEEYLNSCDPDDRPDLVIGRPVR